jgi:hypothetical protein
MNNFVKLTKYMTEESEHYTVRPKVHKSPVTLLDLEPGNKYKHNRRPGLLRSLFEMYSAIAENIARFLLAPGP